MIYRFSDEPSPEEPISTLQFQNDANESAADKAVLDWLKKNSPGCLTKGQSFPLDPSLLRLVAATAKLYFLGQRIVCDFFQKSTLVYSISKNPAGEWTLTGKIRENTREFPLSRVDAIRAGHPPCYIYQNQLKFLASDISWKHLKALYSSPIIIDATWKQELIELQKEGCIECSDPAFFAQTDPLPFLVLTDRTGAFAQLKMDAGNGRITTFERSGKNPVEKQWEADLLETDFIWKPTGNSNYYCPLNKVAKSLTFLLELGWKVVDAQGNQVLLCQNLAVTTQETAQHIVVKGTLQYQKHTANLQDVVGSFNRRERFISLGTGTVGLLPEKLGEMGIESLAAEGEWITEGLSLPKYRAGLLAPLINEASEPIISDALRTLCTGPSNTTLLQEETVGQLFQGNLRHYQQIGLQWLLFLYRMGLHGLLADDMGLGKTIQVIAFLATLEKHPLPTLIVVPTSLLQNWKNEFAQFFPTATVYLHHGPDRSNTLWNSTIVLTTYATLRLDQLLFQKQAFHCIILDEAHFIKNASSQTAQAVFSLNAQFRLSLSGTPVENNLFELWSQFRFLMPGLLGSLDTFSAEVNAGTLDARFVNRIRRQVKPFILRRRKKEVAPELPEKIEQTIWIEMLPEQRMLYDSFLAGARQNLLTKVQLEGAKKHRIEILEVLLRLRQICCHPRLVAGQCEEAQSIGSAKMDQLIDDLETLAQEEAKVLIYSQFTSLLKLVANQIKSPYLYLDGQTQNRAAVVEQFQTDATVPFFLISLKAGGVGLNLTAADYVLLLDPWWNEAAEQQAIDRAHRIGRTEPVIAKRYVVLDSVEEKIMRLKERKSSLISDLFEQQELPQQLTVNDLEWLIS